MTPACAGTSANSAMERNYEAFIAEGHPQMPNLANKIQAIDVYSILIGGGESILQGGEEAACPPFSALVRDTASRCRVAAPGRRYARLPLGCRRQKTVSKTPSCCHHSSSTHVCDWHAHFSVSLAIAGSNPCVGQLDPFPADSQKTCFESRNARPVLTPKSLKTQRTRRQSLNAARLTSKC